jgi:hypothetical protein
MSSLKSSTATRLLAVLALTLGAGQACRKGAPDRAAPLASAAAAASAVPTAADAPKPDPSAAVPQEAPASRVGRNLWVSKCPNWVHGARTRIEDTSDGMRVFITADAEPAVVEIRSRARYLAEGKSMGGDGTGRCPVPRDAVKEVVDIEHGARLTVRAAPGTPPRRLRQQARTLLAEIPKE